MNALGGPGASVVRRQATPGRRSGTSRDAASAGPISVAAQAAAAAIASAVSVASRKARDIAVYARMAARSFNTRALRERRRAILARN